MVLRVNDEHSGPGRIGTARSHPESGRRRIDISFESHDDRLVSLGLINGLLLVGTLGLYSAWAKTEVRRKLWSFTRINGEPLEYTGTGRELFLGLIIVFSLVIVPVFLGGVAVSLMIPGSAQALTGYQFIIYTLFLFLFGVATYRAKRYRLSRSQWRGIRGALTGSSTGYGWTYFWTLAVPAIVITALALAAAWLTGPNIGGTILLGGLIAALWILPWRANKLQQIATTATHFGSQPLTYTGTSRPLYARYLYAWAGSAVILLASILVTLHLAVDSGALETWRTTKQFPAFSSLLRLALVWLTALALCAIITAWYRASQMRHFAHHTHIDTASFRSTVTGAGLAWLSFTNWTLRVGALLTGITTGGVLIYLTGAMPKSDDTDLSRFTIATLDVLFLVVPIVVLTTMATTFAQFRTARYTVSRLSLDGPVDFDAILQSQNSAPRRGEGLAQMFDIDGF